MIKLCSLYYSNMILLSDFSHLNFNKTNYFHSIRIRIRGVFFNLRKKNKANVILESSLAVRNVRTHIFIYLCI